jgi:hypothetical protein
MQIYLFDAGYKGVKCYAAGTEICLRCPLPPRTCNSSCADDTRLKRQPFAPTCLRDYAIWKLYDYVKPTRARHIGDTLAGVLNPDQAETAAAFRQAIDDRADLLESAMTQLKPYLNDTAAETVYGLFEQTVGEGMSTAAFQRAVEIQVDRLAFVAELEREREAAA